MHDFTLVDIELHQPFRTPIGNDVKIVEIVLDQ